MITRWSTRLLGRELGVRRDTVARIWREYGVRPWRAETFKFSADPSWRPRFTTSSGCICTHPNARSCCVRHGTTTLFAALEVATGRIIDQCAPRHRHQEFLGFLKQVARAGSFM